MIYDPSAVARNLASPIALLFVAFLCTDSHAEEPHRPASDLKELLRLKLLHPHELAEFAKGDAALAAGDTSRAVKIFETISASAPDSALLMRRHCEALVWSGQRARSLEVCRRAILLSAQGGATAMRANVAALMLQTPTSDELALALSTVRATEDRSPEHPWGTAARCDVAFRIGDPVMLANCKEKLRVSASGHYEGERVAKLGVATTPFATLAAWLGLFVLCLCTIGHAVARATARGVRRARLHAPALAALATLLFAAAPAFAKEVDTETSTAVAGGLSKWPVNPADPVSSVPTPEQRDSNPVEYGYHIMDLADLASAAVKRNDFAAAAKFYEATTKAVPDVAVGYRNTCEYYQKAGNVERAVLFCRAALGVPGVVVGDHVRYADLIFQQGRLSQEQREDLVTSVKHLRESKAKEGDAFAAQIECELAVHDSSVKDLESCTKKLENLGVQDPRTISFRWSLALMRGEMDKAQSLLALARKSQMTPAGIAAMEKAMQVENTLPRRLHRHRKLIMAFVVCLGLFAGLTVWWTRLRRRPRVTVTA